MLSVLDGAVLVISAVEGGQPQTRVLMRALQRLRIPALLFVNKIDRPGAGEQRVLQAISGRLSRDIVPMGFTHGLGTRAAGDAARTSDPLSHDEYMLQLAGRAAHPVTRRPSAGRAESSHGSS